jgi:hypothetical protein
LAPSANKDYTNCLSPFRFHFALAPHFALPELRGCERKRAFGVRQSVCRLALGLLRRKAAVELPHSEGWRLGANKRVRYSLDPKPAEVTKKKGGPKEPPFTQYPG